MFTRIEDPRRRRIARFWLYGIALVFLTATAVFLWLEARPRVIAPDEEWAYMDFESMPEVDLLRRYVSIDTSRDTGSELAGAEFLAAELERLGLDPKIERLGEKSANLWAVLEGDDPEALVLHSHIDVSPVDEEAWKFPPFQAEIDGPWLYGRGTFDMKSVAAAQLAALEALVSVGRKPKRSVIFLATGGEEHGSDLGARWILAQHPELIERFWVVLTEGGVVEPINHTEIKYWGIEFAQGRYGVVTFCSDDRDSLENLRAALSRLREGNFDLRLTDETETFLRAYGPTRTAKFFSEPVSNPWLALHDPEKFRPIKPYLQKVFRDDLALFPVEENPEGGFSLRTVFLLLPGSDFAAARRRLMPAWLTHGTTYQVAPPIGALHGSPTNHPVFSRLAESVLEVYPEVTIGPHFLAGTGTDSRFFRAAGIPSYGFSPFPLFSTDSFKKDAANERIGLMAYIRGIEIYRAAVRGIAG
ncbi:MAG: M20/M25/M40 family metallo-hydrolase [Acidobacteriota bacterium]|nr:M20/M25/M40 family metallo-hydrolase [Acidobacteriota bacterium]